MLKNACDLKKKWRHLEHVRCDFSTFYPPEKKGCLLTKHTIPMLLSFHHKCSCRRGGKLFKNSLFAPHCLEMKSHLSLWWKIHVGLENLLVSSNSIYIFCQQEPKKWRLMADSWGGGSRQKIFWRCEKSSIAGNFTWPLLQSFLWLFLWLSVYNIASLSNCF